MNDRRLLIEIAEEVGERAIHLHIHVDDCVDLNRIKFDVDAPGASEQGQGKPAKMSSMHEEGWRL